jgi:hypothetical protein
LCEELKAINLAPKQSYADLTSMSAQSHWEIVKLNLYYRIRN